MYPASAPECVFHPLSVRFTPDIMRSTVLFVRKLAAFLDLTPPPT